MHLPVQALAFAVVPAARAERSPPQAVPVHRASVVPAVHNTDMPVEAACRCYRFAGSQAVPLSPQVVQPLWAAAVFVRMDPT